jgi:hypothetical protein
MHMTVKQKNYRSHAHGWSVAACYNCKHKSNTVSNRHVRTATRAGQKTRNLNPEYPKPNPKYPKPVVFSGIAKLVVISGIDSQNPNF